MSTDRPRRVDGFHLGKCPLCEAIISEDGLLADYRHPDEWPRLLATCPECVEVVAPT